MHELGALFRLFMSLVVIVAVIYAIVKITVKIARGDFRRALDGTKQQANQLEKDYTWRRVKVGYVVISTVFVLIGVGAAYGSTVDELPYFEPSMELGWLALIVGSAIAWVVYRFFLPKLYTYLTRSDRHEKREE